MNRLFLLDAMALIYRAYFAMLHSKRITSNGTNTSAAFGFINYLYDILQKEKPTHIGVCIDSFAPTFRHQEYEQYKANREKIPEDIVSNLPYIRSIISAFNIPLIECAGYEADDIIGTIASHTSKTGQFKVYIVTPDKDLCQIVDDNVNIYKPAHGKNVMEIIDKQGVCEKFGIKTPKQVIEYLGLVGDAVDNIPGVTGIGPVAAKKLLTEFDTIDNIIANADSIKNDNIRKKIQANMDNALLSKRLATIETNVPCNHNINDFILKNPDVNAVKTICEQLEFRVFEKRFFTDLSLSQNYLNNTVHSDLPNLFNNSNNNPDNHNTSSNNLLFNNLFDEESLKKIEKSNFATIQNTPHEYILVNNDNAINGLIEILNNSKVLSFDTETTSLNANDCDLVGFSFSVEPHKAYFVTCPDKFKDTHNLIHKFQHILNDSTKLVIGQNIKFDMLVLKLYDMDINAPIFDTMIAHYLINPESRHNMDYLSEIYLKYTPVATEELIGKKGLTQGNMQNVQIETLKEYAAEDADITLQLYYKLKNEITKFKYDNLLNNIEMPLVKVLVSMEHEGVKIDTDFLKKYEFQLNDEIHNIENQIYEYAGQQFNISSPKQLGDILFDKMHLADKPKKTKSGQYSTGEDILQKLQFIHPIVQCILDYRSLSKLLSGYVEPLPELINKRTGRVHTNFNQAVVATGRLSSNNPNLQNIPVRTERGKEIRKAFIPSDDNHVILSADYSQIELRLIAHISKESNMQQAFIDKKDIHSATAATIFDVNETEVDAEMRRIAKTVNFGIIYGISAFGLAERLHVSRSRASFLINQYFIKYPAIKRYMNETVIFAKNHGYVETIMGRRRYIKDINSANSNIRGYAERNAINAPIQGSSADLIKIAMININNKIEKEGMKSKMIIQVHDELVFDTLKEEKSQLTEIVDFEMKNAIKLDIPLEVSIGTGSNWLEAH